MDNKDLIYIKKHYGEEMAKFCRENFATILETPGELVSILTKFFAPSRSLYRDIIDSEQSREFVQFISFYSSQNAGPFVKTDKTPEELLREAGYTLHKCETYADTLKFKKYYTEDEEICTFKDEVRTRNSLVFFAVHKDAEKLDRNDFERPQREDEYSTSVLSIQFKKGSQNVINIISRYNHTVANPNATYSNNLERIIPGLTDSFAREYDLNLVPERDFLDLFDYIQLPNERFYKCNYKFANDEICCGENNVVIKNNKIVMHDRDGELHPYNDGSCDVVDYFVIDYKKKTIEVIDPTIEDSFASAMPNIQNIEVQADKVARTRNIIVSFKPDGATQLSKAVITVDDCNRIIKYYNPSVTKIDSKFMQHSIYLKDIDLPEAVQINDDFMPKAGNIRRVNLPKVKVMGDDCLTYLGRLEQASFESLEMVGNRTLRTVGLKEINLPSMIESGDEFLFSTPNLVTLNADNLERVGERFQACSNVRELHLPSLKRVGDGFGLRLIQIAKLDLPNLEIIGNDFLKDSRYVSRISLPRAVTVGNGFMENSLIVNEVDMPNVKSFGDDALKNGKVVNLNFPNLERVGQNFCSANKQNGLVVNMPKLKTAGSNFILNAGVDEAHLDSLERVGGFFMGFNKGTTSISLPKLAYADNGFMMQCTSLQSVNLPSLSVTGWDFLRHTAVRELDLPNLLVAGPNFCMSCFELESFDAPQVVELAPSAFSGAVNLRDIYIPNCQRIADNCFHGNLALESFDLPEVLVIGKGVLATNKILSSINLPKVQTISEEFLESNEVIEHVNISPDAFLGVSVGDRFSEIVETIQRKRN